MILPEWSDSSEVESSWERSSQHHLRSMSPYRIDISQGVTLSWSNISCYAPEYGPGTCGRSVKTGRYKQLLFHINGVAQPGNLVAIMGASGAGKSTLLNILTCRNLGELAVDGLVKANGVDMGPNIKTVSAYVQQEDVFWGRLTVREHLAYHASLRMGLGYTNEEQVERVNMILTDMGLERCANEYINISKGGRTGYGISGSERKMLSIASELLTDPPLIFCDEPTTGLDAMMARMVVSMLQKMARRGKTILCTIHQPASHIYEHFDQLLLLAEGRLAFQGSKERALTFFNEVALGCPQNYNPADHYIHTLAIRPGQETECRAKVVYIAARYQDTTDHKTTLRKIKAIDKMDGDPQFERVMQLTINTKPYKSSWWTQVKVNTWKQTLDQVRDPAVFMSRILQNVFSVIIYCALYFQQPYNQMGVSNISGATFNLIMHITFLAIIQLNSFCSELGTFYRDHHNGLYRADAFFMAKNISEIPIFAILVFSTSICCYWAMGLYPAFPEFLVFTVVMVLVYQFSLSLNVYLAGIACGRIDIAINVAPPVRMVFMIFGGYLINDASIPRFLNWLKYLSWHRYGFKILMINQWDKVEHLQCENNMDPATCYKSGDDVIKYLNYDEGEVWFDYLMLIVIGFVYRMLALFVLWFKSRERSRNKK